MKPPPFLSGAALLFWGFETDWLGIAIVMAVLVEMALWIRARWELSDADLNRVWDFCGFLFVSALVIRYTSREQTGVSAYAFFQWFPLVFFPMALAQVYGQRERMPATVFSWFLRWRPSRSDRSVPAVHVGYPYFAACLFSAGAANRRDPWFFVGTALLCGWALWGHRPKRCSVTVWMACFGAAVLLAYFGQNTLHQFQAILEGQVSSWMAQWSRRPFDANESRTELGSIGTRQQSGRIILRVRPEAGPTPPLLRQATYDAFRETVWFATRSQFAEVPPDADTSTWSLQRRVTGPDTVTVFTSLPERAGLVSLPLGSTHLENLPVGTVETNALGTMRVTEAPGLLAYRAHFHRERSFELPPDSNVDFAIPPQERAALAQVARDLRLEGKSELEKLAAVQGFFEEHFAYRLFVPENLRRPADADTPLSRFLLRTRQGHCEYFATATVLLLRAAGVPARYATGYSVQERPSSDSIYVVRERHAHAWALVWRNGRWHDFDTTPAGWLETEQSRASAWEWLGDLWSGWSFRFQQWRWLGQRGWLQEVAPWFLTPLAGLLLWRLLAGRKRSVRTAPIPSSPVERRAGSDSEFYQLERRLASTHGARPPGCTLAHWIRGLPLAAPPPSGAREMGELLQLHYRHRFDPAGLSDAERQTLRSSVAAWLEH